MSASPFAAPAPASGGIDLNANLGALLLITVKAQEHGVKTRFGDADPVRADVAILDGPNAGEELEEILLFPRVLISQLRSRIGQRVLGRLQQGTATAGQDPPWILAEATEDDVKLGTAHLAGGIAKPDSDKPPY
jgi:hypothetical protein